MSDSDWNDSSLRSIAVQMNGVSARASGNGSLLAVFNAHDARLEMTLPAPPPGSAWAVLFDTSNEELSIDPRILHCNEPLQVEQRSTVLLESQPAVAPTQR
jgi:glycogen operon protein